MLDKLRIGAKAKATQPFTPEHPDPAIGTSHGITLHLYGKHSLEYRNAVAENSRKAAARTRPATIDEAVEASAELVVACCGGWDGVTDAESGKTEKYSPKKLTEILKDDDFRWLRLAAERFIMDEKNFF